MASKVLSVRLTEQEWAATVEHAADADLSLSDLVRNALENYKTEPPCDECDGDTCEFCGLHAIEPSELSTETGSVAAIMATGASFSDTTNPDVQALIDRAKELLAEGAVGVSVATDLDPAGLPTNPDDITEEMMSSAKLRIRHVAIVDTPAFSGAHLKINDDGTLSGPVVFENLATGDLRGIPADAFDLESSLADGPIPIIFDLNEGDHTGVTIGSVAQLERVNDWTGEMVAPIAASAVGAEYPSYLFSEPEPTAMTVYPPDANGYRRYAGMLAPTRVCHKGRPGCYTYKGASLDYFHTGARIFLDDGSITRVGSIVFGGLHADDQKLDYAEALARTEDARRVVAMGRAYHHPKGLLFSGVLMPDADVMRLQATKPSVELWPDQRGKLELKTALQVNVQGFPVAASAIENGSLFVVDDQQVVVVDDTTDRLTRLEQVVADLLSAELDRTL